MLRQHCRGRKACGPQTSKAHQQIQQGPPQTPAIGPNRAVLRSRTLPATFHTLLARGLVHLSAWMVEPLAPAQHREPGEWAMPLPTLGAAEVPRELVNTDCLLHARPPLHVSGTWESVLLTAHTGADPAGRNQACEPGNCCSEWPPVSRGGSPGPPAKTNMGACLHSPTVHPHLLLSTVYQEAICPPSPRVMTLTSRSVSRLPWDWLDSFQPTAWGPVEVTATSHLCSLSWPLTSHLRLSPHSHYLCPSSFVDIPGPQDLCTHLGTFPLDLTRANISLFFWSLAMLYNTAPHTPLCISPQLAVQVSSPRRQVHGGFSAVSARAWAWHIATRVE